jgi:hypothetical protein
MALGDSLGVSAQVFYSSAGKPLIVSLERQRPGISCEFVIATSGEGGRSSRSQSPSVQTRLSARIREDSLAQRARQMSVQEEQGRGDEEMGVGWSGSGQMSPARTTRSGLEEDLYGDPRGMDGEEEIPPTQQERYQGIFDL